MKCFRCDKSAPAHTLYRVNAKGRPGIWACKDHRLEPDMDLDVAIDEIERMRRGHSAVLRHQPAKEPSK